MPCVCAISARRSESGPGTVTDCCASRAKTSRASPESSPLQPARYRTQRLDGYTGMNVSGKSASRTSSPAACAASFSSLSIVASRSNAIGSACTQATLTTPSMRRSLGENDGVANADHAVVQDVRVQPRPMHEGLDHAGLGHRLEIAARFAELDALALDVPDAEPLPDELVDVDATREHVAPHRRRLDRHDSLVRHRLGRLGRDQRDGLAGRGVAVGPEVAIALEPPSR